MCGFFGNKGIIKNSEIKNGVTISRWKEFIEEIAGYRAKLYFTGGEPLLYQDLFELARYAKNKNLKISLQTNGTLISKKIEDILIFDEINISLDGPTKEINDSIRRYNSFESIVNSLRKLSVIKSKSKPLINLYYTISDRNYKYLTRMVEFLEDSDFKIDNLIFQHLMFVSKEKIEEFKEKVKHSKGYIPHIWDGFSYELKEIDFKIFLKQISEVKKIRNKKFEIKFFPDFTEEECENFYKNSSFLPSRFSKYCLTPYLDAIIFPDGDVYTCQGYVIGNIKENSFRNLWNNVYAKKIRVKLIKEGIFSVCRACCGKYIY